MADVIRTAQYFKVNIADKSGTLGHMLVPLREAGVNLLSVHAFPEIAGRKSTSFRKIPPPSRTSQDRSSGKWRGRKSASWWMAMIDPGYWRISPANWVQPTSI